MTILLGTNYLKRFAFEMKQINPILAEDNKRVLKISDWASPIVLAKKPNNSIRDCGVFKNAVNSQIVNEQHPLPTRESLFHTSD